MLLEDLKYRKKGSLPSASEFKSTFRPNFIYLNTNVQASTSNINDTFHPKFSRVSPFSVRGKLTCWG